jgi:monoamine oxidase
MPERNNAQYDVAVIGAGAAGLAASRLLTQRGLSVALSEARDRIGGRVLTVRPPGSPIPIDLGPSFVHGRPPETMALVEAVGITLYESVGEMVADFQNQQEEDDWNREEGDENGENPILTSLAGYQGEDVSLGTYMSTHFAGPQWEGARQWARGYVAGFDAADPDSVSVQWLAKTQSAFAAAQGDRNFHILDGYDRLMEGLLEQCDSRLLTLHLSAVVRRLSWTPGSITLQLTAPNGAALPDITATRAIVTVPLGVLQASATLPGAPGTIQFDPLPPGLETSLAGLAMGHAIRVVIRFRDRFWDSGTASASFQHPHLSFLVSDHPVMPTWWSNYPLLVPFLSGWVGGPSAVHLGAGSDGDIQAAAVAALADILRWSPAELAPHVLETYFHNWSQDWYARGAYSYVKAGGLSQLLSLSQPVADTLYFAGEATDTEGRTGTVHGALATGIRAAEQILG